MPSESQATILKLCFSLDQFDRKMRRRFSSVYIPGVLESVWLYMYHFSKSVRDRDLKHSVLLSCLHPEIWNFLTESSISNSNIKSSKNAKTQENVGTTLPEHWNKVNKTDRTGNNREQEKRKNLVNMRWNSNILLAVTKYDKYCASVLTESGWFISLI